MDSIIHNVTISINGKKCMADPGTVNMSRRDTIKFLIKDSGGTFFLPKGNFFHPIKSKFNQIIPVEEDEVIEFKINGNSVGTKEQTPYAFYCDEANDFAEGTSSPRIIIDD